MFEPKLGASLHTITDSLTAEALQAVADSRIATLELWPALFAGKGDPAAALRGMLARTGIRAMSVHATFGGRHDISVMDQEAQRFAIAETLSAVNLAAEFGAPLVVVHASAEPITPEERGARRAQARRALEEIGAHAARKGRRIAVELLPRSCVGNTASELLSLLEGLPNETFGVCLDTNHGMDRYRDLPADIRRLGDRLITTHLSDYDGVDEKHWLPGAGVIAWPEVLAAFAEIGYAGPFNFECGFKDRAPEARIRALEASFAWLEELHCQRPA